MKFAKKTDIIVIIILLLVGLGAFFIYNATTKDKVGKAEIFYESKLIKTVDLVEGKEETFTVPGHEDVVFHIYEDGSIAFEESDCPDKVCINSGRLSLVGQSAACLPNKLVLKIVSTNDKNDDEMDLII